eukprot:10282612-Alexandrium_andersonii.AAC.1
MQIGTFALAPLSSCERVKARESKEELFPRGPRKGSQQAATADDAPHGICISQGHAQHIRNPLKPR